jgi:N-methylhydantoinase B
VSLDPVAVEVIGNRLLSIVNEQQATLIRTAFSTIVRESEDLACGVFDARGRMVAQSLTGTPGHINAMATGVRHFLNTFPPERLEPGDVLVTNDPWQTSGQINDFTVVTPVFRDGVVLGWLANTCHSADIGGRVLSGEAREVYEEGLRVPITKLFRAGEPNEELLEIVRINVRTPEETVGDLYAQTACNDVGARRLLELVEEADLDSLDTVAEEILGRSEWAMREAIRELPNGVYEDETWSDGFDEPIRLRVTVIVDDADLVVDFAGSSPQSRYGINVVLNYTHAYASFALKAALAPEVPHNDGSFRPVRVTAPPGSILNALPPAAVGSRHLIGHLLPGLLFGALAPAMPDRLLAGGADSVWLHVLRGQFPRSGDWWSLSLFQAGGMGARATKDGLSATGFPSGVAGVPVEVIETLTPLVQHRRELRTDSGGAGRQRGGLGQHTELSCRSGGPWSISALIDRSRFPARGVEGGRDGAVGEAVRGDGGELPGKRLVQLAPEERIRLNPPGAAGYGDPRERDPELVLRDIADGYISIEAAKRDYGVRISYTGAPDALVRMPSMYEVVDPRGTDRRKRSPAATSLTDRAARRF